MYLYLFLFRNWVTTTIINFSVAMYIHFVSIVHCVSVSIITETEVKLLKLDHITTEAV